MGRILTLALKDLRLLSRDKMGLFFIIGFPILMGVFFGLIQGSFKPESARMTIGLVDEDQSQQSKRFAGSLTKTKGITVQPVEREAAARLVRQKDLAAFIAIPPGFGETAGIFWAEGPAIELGVDPSRTAESGMLQGLIMQAMGELVQQRFNDPAGMRGQIGEQIAAVERDTELPGVQRIALRGLLGTVDQFLGSLDTSMRQLQSAGDGGDDGRPQMELARIQTIDVTAAPSARGQLLRKLRSPWDITFPSAMLWGIMGCVAGFALSIVKERTEGTYLRLRTAPLTRAHILGGKAAGCFLTVVCVVAFMMVLGRILGIQLARPDLLVLATLANAVGFVGLMMLMSVIGRTEQAVGGAGWAIIVVMCMFGGGMIPLAFMPPFMNTLSNFSPVKWGILALEGAIWRGFTLSDMLVPCAVLVGIGLAGFIVGVKLLQRVDA